MKNEKLLKEIIKTTENTIADYIYQLRILKNSLLCQQSNLFSSAGIL